MIDDLRRLLGDDAVLAPTAAYVQDATEGRGVRGRADAVVLPSDADGVARALAWCYAHDVPVTPRGGGSGYAGGAVPVDGGVVLGTERLTGVRALDLHEAVKRAFDPKGLLNPGKKGARC